MTPIKSLIALGIALSTSGVAMTQNLQNLSIALESPSSSPTTTSMLIRNASETDPRTVTPGIRGGNVAPGTSFADYALYSGVLAARTLDYFSTEQVLSHHGHEDLLPSGLVHNKPAFAAYSLGAGGVEILASRMIRKNHSRLARGMLMVDIGGTSAAAGHNWAVTNWNAK